MNRIINNFACININLFIMVDLCACSYLQLTEETSFPGNVMTLIMRRLDLKLFILENYT